MGVIKHHMTFYVGPELPRHHREEEKKEHLLSDVGRRRRHREMRLAALDLVGTKHAQSLLNLALEGRGVVEQGEGLE